MTAGFAAYEQEDDTTKDVAEFTLANAIYAALVESHAAEQNSRYAVLCSSSHVADTPLCSRNAMDNASKNAGDMITSLQMQYNRGRQASITNELVDIITGLCSLALSVVAELTHSRCKRAMMGEEGRDALRLKIEGGLYVKSIKHLTSAVESL